MKHFLFVLGLCALIGLPFQTFAAAAVSPTAKMAVVHETVLDLTITTIKGAVITVKSADKKIFTLKFTAKASMVDEKGATLTAKKMHAGDRLRASGVVKGSVFTASRLRRVSQVTSATADNSYTLAQVATHHDAASCWTVIDEKVYDLTSWIARHPGGEGAILSICGTNGSSAFNDQHGGQGRPAQLLASFKIGTLK